MLFHRAFAAPFLLLVGLALANAGPTSSAIVDSAICDCACQASAGVPLLNHPLTAGTAEECTVARCQAEVAECPSEEASVDSTEISATWYNCGCACCFAFTCPSMNYYGLVSASSRKCTTDDCRAMNHGCPDSGSHNQGAIVTAIWHGVDPPPSAPPTSDPALDHDCQCACAFSAAEELRKYTVRTGEGQKCTAALCSSSFRNCPDVGSHNSGGVVIATAYDCMCSCGDPVQLLPWLAGSQAACSKQGCSAAHFSCPSPSNDPNRVNATFTGRPQQSSDDDGGGDSGGGGGEDEEDEEDDDNEVGLTNNTATVELSTLSAMLPDDAVIALAVMFPLLFAALVFGICYITYFYSRGYRLVNLANFDSAKANVASSSPLARPNGTRTAEVEIQLNGTVKTAHAAAELPHARRPSTASAVLAV
ncbi:hypothetical protein T492DRAFT_903592 [Pavlovales sp. CCMP2436]|nr:hypothetical protein T492DRAFT_903592 [Pavlovales sp. CCMP2436]